MQTDLPTRPFGKTGMEITRTGFGAWAIGGNMWGPQDDADSVAAIRHAVSKGINWIDTAAVYGNGHSEEVIAEALADLAPAERPYVFTKGGIVRDAAGKNPRRRAADLRQQCEDSLKRLKVEVIDLYQLHWPSDDVSLEESWGTMLRLKEDGLVRHVGLSNHWGEQLEEAEAMGHVETLQPPFSMIKRQAAESLLPWCAAHGTGVICYSPMQAGLLTGAFTAERAANLPENDWRRDAPDFQGEALTRNLALADALRPVAEKHGVEMGAVALAWALAWPGLTGAIVGSRSPGQINGWFPAATLELDADDMETLARAIDSTGAGEGPARPG
ncbi:putative aldo/keto reductase [Oceanicola granulosus HTCC2516]|uniref:Putative aldo/keto reductase n=1 Tax=Oceanicola granulosus (strain ATCC BAA-861 / DSM 15982 / KCTC 12143 / HTCC2516) TaxID=314256 RepID=Q2CK20_OCEGH|nr:aldo/keto reductase [Oceanicola granulosus]EAR52969.1 putative aldo/keto reductase [Oceanicola granulosus HTCC2516]